MIFLTILNYKYFLFDALKYVVIDFQAEYELYSIGIHFDVYYNENIYKLTLKLKSVPKLNT